MKIKQYSALADNLFRQLAKGNAVIYNGLLFKAEEDKLVVKGKFENKDMELHYRLKKGDRYGFSKEQFKNIVAAREKPIYRVTLSGRLNKP
jgi:hypothetical protein